MSSRRETESSLCVDDFQVGHSTHAAAASACIKKINVSPVLAGQGIGIKKGDDSVWRVTFMRYNIGLFDDESCRLEPAPN